MIGEVGTCCPKEGIEERQYVTVPDYLLSNPERWRQVRLRWGCASDAEVEKSVGTLKFLEAVTKGNGCLQIIPMTVLTAELCRDWVIL